MKISKSSVVCDAGPIIHLHELDCLHLLGDFPQVILPYTIELEVQKHRNIDIELYNDINWFPIASPFIPIEPLRSMCLKYALDAGEVAALAVLQKFKTAIFLTDDSAARIVATKCGYKAHGTIGVLIRSIRMGTMRTEEIIEILENIPFRSTLHIKTLLLSDIISRIRHKMKTER